MHSLLTPSQSEGQKRMTCEAVHQMHCVWHSQSTAHVAGYEYCCDLCTSILASQATPPSPLVVCPVAPPEKQGRQKIDICDIGTLSLEVSWLASESCKNERVLVLICCVCFCFYKKNLSLLQFSAMSQEHYQCHFVPPTCSCKDDIPLKLVGALPGLV